MFSLKRRQKCHIIFCDCVGQDNPEANERLRKSMRFVGHRNLKRMSCCGKGKRIGYYRACVIQKEELHTDKRKFMILLRE